MKEIKTNETQHHYHTPSNRKMDITEMSEHEPSTIAKQQMQHIPYQIIKRNRK